MKTEEQIFEKLKLTEELLNGNGDMIMSIKNKEKIRIKANVLRWVLDIPEDQKSIMISTGLRLPHFRKEPTVEELVLKYLDEYGPNTVEEIAKSINKLKNDVNRYLKRLLEFNRIDIIAGTGYRDDPFVYKLRSKR